MTSAAEGQQQECAIVFGASGAIGLALTAALVRSRRYGAVYAGTRSPCPALPGEARRFAFDLTNEASIAAAMGAIDLPPALILVASGVLHDPARSIAPEKSWRQIDAAAMAQVLAINTIGPALIARHALPLIPPRRRAVFAALSARVGSIGDNRLGGWHSYRASKAALNMLVANFAIELARTRPMAIAAAIHPGTVASDLSAPFVGSGAGRTVLSPEASAGHILAVLDALQPADSGALFGWDGQRIAW